MNKQIYIALFLITGIALSLLSWHYYHKISGDVRIEPVTLEMHEFQETKKAEASRLAQKYIDGIPNGVVLLNETDASAQKEIEFWKNQINDYAKDSVQLDQNKILEKANQIASLFRLLKDASANQRAGQEPYTPLSGFNTMALAMKVENGFKEELGFSLSEFLFSQDAEIIKNIIHQ